MPVLVEGPRHRRDDEVLPRAKRCATSRRAASRRAASRRAASGRAAATASPPRPCLHRAHGLRPSHRGPVPPTPSPQHSHSGAHACDAHACGARLSWRWRQHGILFNRRNDQLPSAAFDTACGTFVTRIPAADSTAYHLITLAPHFSRVGAALGGQSIVHHMDLFLCDETVTPPSDAMCMSVPYLSERGPCYAMVWAYDRGATQPYALPADAGLRVGRGTRFRSLVLFVHYGLPHGGVSASELARARYVDMSGVLATLVRTPRRLDAWSFEFMQTDMAIPAMARDDFEYVSHPSPAGISAMLTKDIAAGGGAIVLHHVHAHAHDHATRVSLHRKRDGEWVTLLHIEPYCGYGACQRFHNLSGGAADAVRTLALPELRLGDTLEFRCRYRNQEGFQLRYGLSSGNEMCGAIVVYTPHVSTAAARQVPTWFGGGHGDLRRVEPPHRQHARRMASGAGGM